MNSCMNLKENYLNEIKVMKRDYRENAKRLTAEGAEDEAILESIKINIIDIFTTMFNISFNKVYSNIEDEKDQIKKFKEEYFKFFEKIPGSWHVKMVRDKENNMMEEYYKEKIKLEVADEMKNIFIKYYNKCFKED